MRVITALFFLVLATLPGRARMPEHKTMTFVATGHSQKGETASGIHSQVGTVAADPKVLPLGSRIRVTGSGRYSGEYTVADTGALVKGRRIDIYMRSGAEARKFGKQNVKVRILSQERRRVIEDRGRVTATYGRIFAGTPAPRTWPGSVMRIWRNLCVRPKLFPAPPAAR